MNTSRGSTTKQHPFFCPNEVIVSGLETWGNAPNSTDYGAISRSWRVDLTKSLVQGPIQKDTNDIPRELNAIEAGATATPESVPRCLDGRQPLLLDPGTLPDENVEDQ
ncbi:MAG TPA: hypothetical protein VGF86_09375 [Candidatus Tumulicola sp.]